jgi:GTP pyrophosphokinase
MDEIAEKGYAAHYKYKNGATKRRIGCLVELTKEALENSQTSAVDFVEDFKMNLYWKFMFYTKEILNPYQRATSLDFFSIHSEIVLRLVERV